MLMNILDHYLQWNVNYLFLLHLSPAAASPATPSFGMALQVCGKGFTRNEHVRRHAFTHSGEKPYLCPSCGKAFSRPWLLQGHMRSHTGEKPFGCASCGKSFADRSNLRAHMQTHSQMKNFHCKRCNKSFALKSYLNKHYESACYRDGSGGSSDECTSPLPDM